MSANASAHEGFLASGLLTARHGFFTRQGGVSTGIYASLNGGFGAKGDTLEAVRENRRRAAAMLDADPEQLVSVYQTHSPDAVLVEEPWTRENAPEADAMVAAKPGLALGVLSADCAPVLLEDPETGVVGAAHAGWRGAIGGVIEGVVAAMERRGAARGRIAAAIGPCIGPQAYEVGPEFHDRFVAANEDYTRFFGAPGDAAAVVAGKARFDLPAFVLHRLAEAGVGTAAWIGRCTYAEETLFFSNRRAVHREEGDYGRLLSVIVAPER